MDNSDRRESALDGVRCLAFLGVFASHVSYCPWGAYGVRVFFVLSGFLIGRILLRQHETAGDLRHKLFIFYARRTLRIFPAYYALVAAVAVLGVLHVHAVATRGIVWQLSYLTNFFRLTHGSVGSTDHLWSLAIEEQFYLAAPLVILVLGRRSLSVAVALFLAAAAGASILNVTRWHIAELYLVLSFSCLAIGVAAAVIERDGSFLGVRPPALYQLGAMSFAIAVIVGVAHFRGRVRTELLFASYEWLVCFASAALVLALWRGQLPAVRRVLSFAPVVYLGQISYGLYLFHSPVLFITGRLLSWRPGFILLALGGSIAAAALSWHFLETPINALKRRFPYASRLVPAAHQSGEKAGDRSRRRAPQSGARAVAVDGVV